MFADFIKKSRFRHHKVDFFQTTYRQFNFYNGLVDYNSFNNNRWYHHTKHAKSKLAILNGHYGLYYTMYNHDEKNSPANTNLRLSFSFLINYPGANNVEIYMPSFTISEANLQIYLNLDTLKNVVFKQLFSPLSVIIPKLNFSCKRHYTQNHKENHQIKEVVDLGEEEAQQIHDINESVASKDSFLNSQVSYIYELYNTNSPEKLNMIYPIYQSIIRNDSSLPNIELYDIVLTSIISRDLDSNHNIVSIEAKLTTLLTVYQHLLHHGIKPSVTTYNIIINELLSCGLLARDLITSESNQFEFNQNIIKSQEFTKMGIDIFESIKQYELLDLNKIFPNLLSCLINYPQLMNQNLLSKVITTEITRTEEICTSLIELSTLFSNFPKLFDSSQESYQYIVSIYGDYKELCSQNVDEFKVYASLIKSLVHNNHFKLASKFLDDILSDYKQSLLLDNKPSKQQISLIISSYISSIMRDSSDKSLHEAFKLLMKFNKISYLPELSPELYNEMIIKFINQYYNLLTQKSKLAVSSSSKLNEITNAQVSCLQSCWKLYNLLAIRKDYQNGLEMPANVANKLHCRDLLLSLSIELCDHANIFQLIKEILLKGHLVFDINIFKKLLAYLYNGVIQQDFNYQYYGLIWNLVETQSKYYKDSNSLNNFLSDVINYMVIIPNESFVEFNAKQLMNSEMLSKAIDSFDYQLDNIYGISVISNFLSQVDASKDSNLMNKILNFQAKLINQFEDTENHYIQLNQELCDLKIALKQYFKSMIAAYSENIVFTTDMLHASKNCDIELAKNLKTHLKLDSQFEADLSYLLNINYEVGVEKFLELFAKSYNFNLATWEIIVNHNFAHANLLGSKFSIDNFIERLFESEFELESKVDLLHTLVKFDLENINIHVVKFLVENPSKLSTGLLTTLIENLKDSNNRYLKQLAIEESGLFFNRTYEHNSELTWVVPYSEFLIQENQSALLVELFQQNLILNVSTDKKLNEEELKVVINYLRATISMGNLSEFNTLFKNFFVSNNFNKGYLSESNDLIEVLIEYYLSRENIDGLNLILAKFKAFKLKSQKIHELLLYTSFLKSINDPSFNFNLIVRKAKSLDELSLRLISCSDVKELQELAILNKSMIRNQKQQLVSTIFQRLILASKSKLGNEEQLAKKFVMILKSFKHMHIKKLSVLNLSEIITYLTLNNCKELLHVIIVKLINNNEFCKVFNLYFMETVFRTKEEQSHVLNLLYQACTYLKDNLNMLTIQRYSQSNDIKLTMERV